MLLRMSGDARLFQGTRRIADATFELEVDVDVAPRVTGWVQPVNADGTVFLESGPVFTLVFEDGRRLDFVVARPRTTSVLGRYDIAAMSGFYRQSASPIRFLS